MGKIYGSNKVIGTVGRLRHYRLPGVPEIVVAECGGATKEQIATNAAFVRTRENNQEWKAVTQMAKQVKLNFGQSSATIVSTFLIGFLNKAMLEALRMDEAGTRGSRSLLLSAHKDVLDAITYYYYKPFGDIMKCRYAVDTGPDRKSVTVTLPNFKPKEQIKPPDQATHFQYCLSVGAVSDIVYDKDYERYTPVYNKVRMEQSLKVFESEWIPINERAMGDVTYSVTLPEAFILADDMTVVRTFGIVFGKMTSEVEPLKRDRGSIVFLGAV